jgi:uncharacterized protein YceH (UPF0502 family)
MSASHLPVLSLLETRVLGVLCEKQHTVPDTYPLSLNALVAGCNQKSSRHPVILTVLMLRGPQTAGELRINCERLHKFADISAVEAFLNELAARPDGALVVELPRQPGARENRWAHLLSGEPAEDEAAAAAPAAAAPTADVSVGEIAALKANVTRLEAQVGELQAMVAKLCTELGITD